MCKAIQAASHFRVPLGLVHFNAQEDGLRGLFHTSRQKQTSVCAHAHTHPTLQTHYTVWRGVPLGWPGHCWQRRPRQLGCTDGGLCSALQMCSPRIAESDPQTPPGADMMEGGEGDETGERHARRESRTRLFAFKGTRGGDLRGQAGMLLLMALVLD